MSALEQGEVQADVIHEMRALAERGVDIPELVEHLQHRLGLPEDKSLLKVLMYFRAAFCLTLREALPLREWLGGQDRTEVDSILIPAMRCKRELWQSKQVQSVY